MTLADEIAVWGDALLERGDPLGEIIARSRSGADDQAVKALQADYEYEHFKDKPDSCLWAHGVIDEISISTIDGRGAMDEITRCPATRFLRVLGFRVPQSSGATDPSPILAGRGLPELRSFVYWPRFVGADISNIYPAIPKVEELALWGPERLGVIDLPSLQVLRLLRMSSSTLRELRLAKAPRLTALEIVGSSWTVFDGLDFPEPCALERLRVGRTIGGNETDEDWDMLLSAPLLKRAKRLELVGTFGPTGESNLLPRVALLAAFEEVRLVRPRSPELVSALERTLGPKLGWIH